MFTNAVIYASNDCMSANLVLIRENKTDVKGNFKFEYWVPFKCKAKQKYHFFW